MYVTRNLEKKIIDWLDEREIIAVIGPRQCGKTTLIKHLADDLIRDGKWTPNHLIYRDFDDELERLEFQRNPKKYIERFLIDGERYLFLLDEVQYIESAGRCLKVLFDRYGDRAKFIITGSSSLDVRGLGASLVGRVVYFELQPFSFSEFLRARNPGLSMQREEIKFDFSSDYELDNSLIIGDLNEMLEEYMTYGGFPRIVLLEDIDKKELLLRQLVTLYIEKDILKMYGQAFRDSALRILQYLAFHSGKLMNEYRMSNHLKIDKMKIAEIMDILENSFIIRRIRPFYKNLTTEIRKMPKVCFLDNGLRNALAEDFRFHREKGFLLENHVFTQLLSRGGKINYWRTKSKAEVDLILDGTPMEVKATPRLTRAFRSFIGTYDPPFGLLINYDVYHRQLVNDTPVLSLPAALL